MADAVAKESGPFVRLYQPGTDDASVDNIFRITAHTSLHSEPALTIASHLWAKPYTHLSPSFCHVLDPGTAPSTPPANNSSSSSAPITAVGYIIGTPDTAAFAASWRTAFLPTLSDPILTTPPPPPPSSSHPSSEPSLATTLLRQLHAPEPALTHPDDPELLRRFPAHLHIDIVPGFQGRGLGQALMGAFLGQLRGAGVGGVHLQMAVDNTDAERFYERWGFRRWGDGKREGEGGAEWKGVMVLELL